MGINNYGLVYKGVGEAHSSEEASNDRGAKGLYWKYVKLDKNGSELVYTYYRINLFFETETISKAQVIEL